MSDYNNIVDDNLRAKVMIRIAEFRMWRFIGGLVALVVVIASTNASSCLSTKVDRAEIYDAAYYKGKAYGLKICLRDE